MHGIIITLHGSSCYGNILCCCRHYSLSLSARQQVSKVFPWTHQKVSYLLVKSITCPCYYIPHGLCPCATIYLMVSARVLLLYSVVNLMMSPVSDCFLSGSLDRTIRLWDLRSQNCQGVMHLNGRPVASYDPEGLIFAAGIDSRQLKLYDLRTFDKVSVFCS